MVEPYRDRLVPFLDYLRSQGPSFLNRLKVPCFQESLLYNAINRSIVKSKSQQFNAAEALTRRDSTDGKLDLDSELDLMTLFFEWSEYYAKTKRMQKSKQ